MALRLLATGLAALPPRTRETAETASSPYARSNGKSCRGVGANGSPPARPPIPGAMAPMAYAVGLIATDGCLKPQSEDRDAGVEGFGPSRDVQEVHRD